MDCHLIVNPLGLRMDLSIECTRIVLRLYIVQGLIKNCVKIVRGLRKDCILILLGFRKDLQGFREDLQEFRKDFQEFRKDLQGILQRLFMDSVWIDYYVYSSSTIRLPGNYFLLYFYRLKINITDYNF